MIWKVILTWKLICAYYKQHCAYSLVYIVTETFYTTKMFDYQFQDIKIYPTIKLNSFIRSKSVSVIACDQVCAHQLKKLVTNLATLVIWCPLIMQSSHAILQHIRQLEQTLAYLAQLIALMSWSPLVHTHAFSLAELKRHCQICWLTGEKVSWMRQTYKSSIVREQDEQLA